MRLISNAARRKLQPSQSADWRQRGTYVAGLLLLALASGCQQGMYEATALPAELAVAPLVDTQTLDLARLSSGSADSQRIYPGDQLSLSMVTGAEETTPEPWPVLVSENGTAQIPLVGAVQLAGHDLQSAQTMITNASIQRGVFKRPTVSITVDARRTNRVTVMGAVAEPAEYEMSISNSDLLTAIGLAGGLSANADTIVEISQPPLKQYSVPAGAAPQKRTSSAEVAQVAYESPAYQSDTGLNGAGALMAGHSQRGRVDLARATMSPPPSGFPLRDGSVVIVRARPARYVHVMGLVNKPDQFELPTNRNIRVLDAIAMAGGRTYTLADRVFVVRPIPYSAKPALIEVSVREAKENNAANILLTDGDVVSVEETPTTMVLGVLNQFIRFGVNGSIRAF